MNERARKRYVCFRCGFNVKAKRFPRQRNWRRTCECAVTPPPTSVNLVTIGSIAISHTSNFSKIGQSDPKIRRWEKGVHVRAFIICTCTARARTCRDAPHHPWLVESTYLVTHNPHTKFEHNRPNRSWDTEARCARAHVQRYSTHDLC